MASKLLAVFLILLNIIHVAIALGLTVASVWFFSQLVTITNIRNPSQIATNFNVYWPQALPWVFFLSAVLCLIVSCCGFVGAGKRINGLVRVYMTFEVISILALILAAALALVYGNDPQHTDAYINDVFSSAFNNVRLSRGHDPSVAKAYGQIEKSLYCCGSNGPEDYKQFWTEYPESCCDTVYKGCNSFTSGIATQKSGCAVVAAAHAKFYLNLLAYASIIAAVLGLANVFVAFVLSKSLNDKSNHMAQDTETKKVLI